MPQEPLTKVGAVQLPGDWGAPVSGDPRRTTFVVLRLRLLRSIGSPVDIDSATLDSWLVDAVSELQGMIQLDELKESATLSLSPGVDRYLLPLGVGAIRGISSPPSPVGLQRKLGYVDNFAWRQLPDADGPPIKWHRQGDLIAFWPRPMSVELLTMDFEVRLSRPTANEDQLLIGSEWDWPLLNLAKYIALNELGQQEQAAAAFNVALASIRSKRSREAEERQQGISSLSFPRDWSDMGVPPMPPSREDD